MLQTCLLKVCTLLFRGIEGNWHVYKKTEKSDGFQEGLNL